MNTERNTDDNRAVLDTVIDSLDQSIEHLDGYTLSRLNQARQRALSEGSRPRRFNPQWIKAGAVTAVLLALVNGWVMFSNPDVQQLPTDDFELVVNEDFELMKDLEFFAWMIEQEHAS